MIEIISIVIWFKNISFLLEVECLNIDLYKFFIREFDVISSWEEIVFIIVVKIVEIRKFVIIGWNKIFFN